MNLTRHRLASTIATVLAASIYGCGGDSITLPSQAEPAHIVLVTGNAQAGIAGSVLPLPLIVKVTNALDKPVPGQGVEFTVTSGGGGVSLANVETGSDGRASVTWTLGASAGAQAVQAKVVGAGVPDNLTFEFSATAIAGSGSLIAAVSGDDQGAPVNSSLPESLVVRVSDGNGNPVSGITITWTVQGGGSISPETVVTDDGGRAAAERVLGPTAGQQTAQAAGDGLAGSPVTFVQTAVASNPTALTLVSGDAQGAPAGFELAGDLVVQLTDADGNGVGGLAVAWLVTTGGGTPNPQNSTTDPAGFARTRWTLGTVAGPNTMTAVYSGLPPVSFTATGSNDAPTTIALVSGDNQTAVGGAALPQPLVVKVTDANNNPVPDVSVAWTAVGAGTVSGGVTTANSPTNGQGLAQITRTLGTTLGAYTTTAEVTGLAGSPVTFASTASVGPAAKIVILTQPSTSAVDGVQLAVQPVVQVQDAGGNGVGPSGRAVTASLLNPPSGSSPNGDLSKDTDAGGTATFTDLGITGLQGTYTIRFRSGGLAEARADVTITPGALSGSKSSVVASPTSVDAGVTTNITVTAMDVGGNPLQGLSVGLSATGSNNAFVPISGSTDALGKMTATYSSTSLGTHTINALINGNTTVTTPVAVDAGPPDAGQSTVTASPASIASGGTSTVTVTAKDAGGNLIQGATVVLSADGSATGVTQPTGTTNGSGVATGSYTSTAIGSHTITAKINGTDITDDATVTVTVGSVSASQSALAVDNTNITAGDAGSLVTVTAKDAQGHPISGATVVLAASNGGSFTTPALTDPSGVTTATFTSTVAGDHNITATINAVGISADATVTVEAAAAATAIFSQPPSDVAAGATMVPAVVVHVEDQFGNPATGSVDLAFAVISGSGSFTGTTPQPLVNGDATFSDLSVSDLGGYTLTGTSGSASTGAAGFVVGP